MDDTTMSNNSVLVKGIGPKITHGILKMYFENPKKSGGGKICDIKDFRHDSAVISFVDPEVADNVINRPGHEIMGCVLHVSVPPENVELPSCIVKVEKIPAHLSEEMIKLIFEHEETSGGDEIQQLTLNRQTSTAFIEYHEVAVAKRVAARDIVKYEELLLPVSLYLPTPADPRIVEVLDVPPNTHTDQLKSLFTNERHSGGGDILKLEYFPDRRMAQICYKEESVASRVLARKALELDDDVFVRVRPHQPEEVTEEDSAFWIQVEGINLATSQKQLKILFDNENQGGGDITDIDLRKDNKSASARIRFRKSKVAKRMIEKGTVLFATQTLIISPPTAQLQPSKTSMSITPIELPSKPRVIYVDNVSEDIEPHILKMFFENRPKSGGGPIDNFVKDEITGKYIITFRDEEAATRVAMNKKLSFDGNPLAVTLEACPVMPVLFEGRVEDDKIIVKNLSDDISTDSISLCLSTAAEVEVEELVYGVLEGRAMAIFVSKIDFGKVANFCLRNPLNNRFLEIQQIPVTYTIQIHGNNLDEETISGYMASKNRSGGGNVTHICYGEGGCLLVTFKDLEAKERVCDRSRHKFMSEELIVREYYEALGVIPPDFDTSRPNVILPSDLDIKVKPGILEYITANEDVKKYFVTEMTSVDAKLVFLKHSSESIRVCCSLSPRAKNVRKMIPGWKDSAERKFSELIGNFDDCSLDILADAWPRVIGEVKEMTHQVKDCQARIEEWQHRIVLYGHKNAVSELSVKLTALTESVSAAMTEEKQQISETLNLQSEKIKMLLKIQFDSKINEKYPKVVFRADVQQQVVSFSGLPSNVIEAKLEMYSQINKMVLHQCSFDSEVVELLSLAEVFNHFEALCVEMKKDVVLQTTKGKFFVLALDIDEAEKVEELIDSRKKKKVPTATLR